MSFASRNLARRFRSPSERFLRDLFDPSRSATLSHSHVPCSAPHICVAAGSIKRCGRRASGVISGASRCYLPRIMVSDNSTFPNATFDKTVGSSNSPLTAQGRRSLIVQMLVRTQFGLPRLRFSLSPLRIRSPAPQLQILSVCMLAAETSSLQNKRLRASPPTSPHCSPADGTMSMGELMEACSSTLIQIYCIRASSRISPAVYSPNLLDTH